MMICCYCCWCRCRYCCRCWCRCCSCYWNPHCIWIDLTFCCSSQFHI